MKISMELRGKKIDLDELTDLRAVQADRMRARSDDVKSTLKTLKSAARKEAKEIPDDVRSIFESVGWVFARNRETTVEAARSLTSDDPQAAVRRVFINRAGDVLVESNRLSVRLESKLDRAGAVANLQGFRILRKLGFAENLFEVGGQPGYSIEQAAEVAARTSTTYAEPQLLQRISSRMRPTDPFYRRQWQWNNDGSSGGLAGADVRAENAWNRTLANGIRIAVIDNGMDIFHEDLKDGLAGGGYFDDDGQGSGPFVPFTPGDPEFPKGNHGTFCLGMVGARMNNKLGGVGGAPECTLMPIACLRDQIGTQATLARAVAVAAEPSLEDAAASRDQGAHVISCSLGPSRGADWDMENVLQDAIDFAVTRGRGGLGAPVLWAVSNGDHAVARDQVSSYQHTIAVGRSSRLDLAHGSAHGPELDFLAPGVEVYSTTQGGGYDFATGTSYATPCAAAVAGLVLAVHPQLTWQEVRDRLRATCDKIGPDPYAGKKFGGRNDRYGFGRINAGRAAG